MYDGDGARIAQADTRILNDRHLLPAEWDMEDQTVERVYGWRRLMMLAQGEYAVRLLVYDADTLEPLSLLDAAGNPAGIEAEMGDSADRE